MVIQPCPPIPRWGPDGAPARQYSCAFRAVLPLTLYCTRARAARARSPPPHSCARARYRAPRSRPADCVFKETANELRRVRRGRMSSLERAVCRPQPNNVGDCPLRPEKSILLMVFRGVSAEIGAAGGAAAEAEGRRRPPLPPRFRPTHHGKPSTRSTFSRPQGAGGGCAATIGFFAESFLRPIERLKVE